MLIIAALSPLALVLLSPTGRASLGSMVSLALGAGVVAGVFLLFGALLGYVHWRTTSDPWLGWVVAALILLAAQVLVNAELALAPEPVQNLPAGWSLVPDLATAVLAALVCGAGLRARAARMRDPLVIGVSLAVAVLCLRLALGGVDGPMARPGVVLVAVAVVVAHLAVATLVLRNTHLQSHARDRLAATIVLIGLSSVAASLGSRPGDLAAAALMSVAGIVWAHVTWKLLQQTIAAQTSRAAALEGSLMWAETSTRKEREQLHEVRSIVAGLASASHLLDGDNIPDDVRQRLEHAISAELGRLERVLVSNPSQPVEQSTVDLDEVLENVLQLHRARGRTVEWEPTGGFAVGRLDAVAEAVNILLENAIAHGGGAGSKVTVKADLLDDIVRIIVSDQGPGVPEDLRSRVFDWGTGRPDSPGQGIGLNLAHRLVTEQGGTITLEHPEARGSTFVIKLPAARWSQEYDRVDT